MRCLLPAVHIVHSWSGIARQRCRAGVLLGVPLRSRAPLNSPATELPAPLVP
ncbi:hypothetical protein T09_15364, partial [Trichinella sp. T9]